MKIILLVIVILFSQLNPGCKGPEQYEPPEDSLIPPPSAPQLLFPPNDTHYVFGQGGQGWDYVIVQLEWTAVSGAELYELHISNTSTFTDTLLYTVFGTTPILSFGSPRHCYWRVRAESELWTWYTDWSETGYFRLAWPPSE